MPTRNMDNVSKIPLTFGISGHRHILEGDAERASNAVIKTIRHFRNQYPNTPFLFISPLADGADCIAAKAALSADSNLKLLVVYPFSINEYAKTISPAWRADFKLLSSDSRIYKTINLDANLAPQEEECRVEQYRKVGHFVAFNSHVLFIFKNHEESNNDGGTAEIMEFRKIGCINHRILDDHRIQCSEEGLLYELRVRKPEDKLENKPHALDDYFYFTPNIGNSQRSSNASRALGISKPKSSLFIVFLQKKIFKKYPDVVSRNIEILNQFLIHDSKNVGSNFSSNSQSFQRAMESVIHEQQKKYYNSLKLVFIFAALASIFQGFEKQIFEIPMLDGHHSIKYFFITAAFFFWGKTQLFDYKNIYESYRAIAEGLRVQEYWFRVGFTSTAADFLLRAQIGPNSWVRRVVRTVWLMDYLALQKAAAQDAQIIIDETRHLIKDWVDGQINYFEKKIKLLKEQKRFYDLLIRSLLISTGVFFTLSLSVVGHFFKFNAFLDSIFESIAETCFILFFLTKAYVEMKGFEISIKRYEASEHTFKQTKSKHLFIENSNSSDQHKAVTYRLLFRSLGESVLDEVSDWYIANTRMEFKPPGG
jgi:hypothetical protein